jgi:hypothetical protein
VEPAHPGDVAARLPDAGDKAAFDRVVTAREHDRDRAGRLHGDERRIVAASCGDHGHLTPDEFGRERRQPIPLSLRPAEFDRDVLTLDVAGLVQASAKGGNRRSERLRRLSIEEPDHRHHWLLRACRERPRRKAAERDDEFPPPDVDCHATLPWGSCPCNTATIPRFSEGTNNAFALRKA